MASYRWRCDFPHYYQLSILCFICVLSVHTAALQTNEQIKKYKLSVVGYCFDSFGITSRLVDAKKMILLSSLIAVHEQCFCSIPPSFDASVKPGLSVSISGCSVRRTENIFDRDLYDR